jgi:hypothetical protein
MVLRCMSQNVTVKRNGGLKDQIKEKVAGFFEWTAHKLIELWWLDFAFAVAGALLLLLVVRLRGRDKDTDESL